MKLSFLTRRDNSGERLAERIAAATTPSHAPAAPPPPPPAPARRYATQPPGGRVAPAPEVTPQPAFVDPDRTARTAPQPRPGAEARRRSEPLPQVEDARNIPVAKPAAPAPIVAPPAPAVAAPKPPVDIDRPSPVARGGMHPIPAARAPVVPPPAPAAPAPAAPAAAAPVPAAPVPAAPSAQSFAGKTSDVLDPRAILASVGEVVYHWDVVADRLEWGPNLREALDLGAPDEVASGVGYASFLAPQSATSRYDAIKAGGADLGAGVPYQIQYGLMPNRRGPVVWVEDTGRWFCGPNGQPARAHGVVRVITERYEAEKQLAFRSHYDPLTGALNRARLIEHLTRVFAAEPREHANFCVLLAGIENLFALNRNYGYDVADELIAGVSNRLRATMRAHDVIARYAGNKFALVLHSCDGEQMEVAVRRFMSAVGDTAIETTAGPVPVSLRMGGVVCPRQGRTPQVALQHAEEALDLARKPIGLRFVGYEQSLVRDDARMRALIVADEIVTALNQGRIAIALQPVVHAATGEVAFMESLVRLLREDGSTIPPDAILPVAEKAGLIHMVDQRVLELTVAEMVADPSLRTAINASGATVHDPEWVRRLGAICAMHPGVAERLTIEITETVAIEDIEMTRRIIAAMKECGVKVAIDDFGAGHTSFRNLRNLDVDLLKIDGAFMQNLARSPDDRFFVRTLVDLARHLKIPTVAEWVENAETAALLAEWGVDFLQGHHFGRAQLIAPRDVSTGQAVA